MRRFQAVLLVYAVVVLGMAPALAQVRVPATPLIAHNPYFSIWSTTDSLTGSDTSHWTGAAQPMAGIARIDGRPYRFLGTNPDSAPAMQQMSQSITPTHTRYCFSAGGVQIEFVFFTPAMMNDLDVLSRPVTYLTWEAHSTDGAAHKVSILFDVDPVIAVNDGSQNEVAFRNRTGRLDVLSVGSRDQHVLNRSGDNLRIDWGYFRLAAPRDEAATTVLSGDAVGQFVRSGTLPASDELTVPGAANRKPHLAAVLNFDAVGPLPVKRHLLVSYTEEFAIQYLERNLRPYWQRHGMTTEDMLDTAEGQYDNLEKRGKAFDEELTHDLAATGSEHYASLAILAYRQTLAANVLVADVDGKPLMFPKENFSNGCISTVDVLYPASPLFLFLQPKLLEAQLVPVLEYASLPRWKFHFAPHDLGQYPLANGQVYGGGERTEEDQMPVEESGNMLIMLDALARAENNADIARRYWPQLTQWAAYLRDKGFDPENQLTTDDFAGHVARNANLSIKAIEALGAYADLAHLLNNEAVAREYQATAKSMAAKWVTMDREGDHYKLAFDSPGTWSQKYNLVWDKILNLGLFPAGVRESELAFYMTKVNAYGLPLDNRADYTKLDWSVWTATLATDPKQFNAILDATDRWLRNTPNHVPLTDWYDTKTAKKTGFQARSVVGGVYIKALSDAQLSAKWRSNDALTNP